MKTEILWIYYELTLKLHYPFIKKVLFVTILQHIPLGAVDGGFDVITVLRLT